MVDVTQADKAAAAEFLGLEMNQHWGIKSLEKAFARYRIEAEMRGALAMREAADILEVYAEYIRSVKACELERHPYLPQVEEVISKLRATIGESHE